MKVLNLYCGIGGNRKLWKDCEVTAVEIDEDIAKVYADMYPNDKVIVGDAHKYLLEHYQEFDFIWSSPPCPTHSRMRRINMGVGERKSPPTYPNMQLYEEIILLKHFFKGLWCVENVISFYEPLIKPQNVSRHYVWANFIIPNIKMPPIKIKTCNKESLQELHGINLDKYDIKNKRLLLRNCVNPKLALHIYENRRCDKK
jgi:DNA (cytosine-5)-methyltransferase 1